MVQSAIRYLRDRFIKEFNKDPLIVRSPGRINLIGEHTDYNEGFVLPGTIDKVIYIAAAKSGSEVISVVADDPGESYRFELNSISKTGLHWADYVAGTVAEMSKAGYKPGGFECIFGGDIPIGAGLSSSAALCSGIAFILNELFSLGMTLKEMALIAQAAEHNFAGVKCGIMDQFANLHGQQNNLIKLDCRSLEYEYIPFDFPNVSIILLDSGIKHALATSEYNKRRSECEEGIRIIRGRYPEVINLRDVDFTILEEFAGILPEKIYLRCSYVVEENERVVRVCEYLKQGDISKTGELLSLTHESLRADYEVSIPEMDQLVYSAMDIEGVYGSRMMGGGFGGCTINLINKNYVEKFIEKMDVEYSSKTGRKFKVYDCQITKGTSLV